MRAPVIPATANVDRVDPASGWQGCCDAFGLRAGVRQSLTWVAVQGRERDGRWCAASLCAVRQVANHGAVHDTVLVAPARSNDARQARWVTATLTIAHKWPRWRAALPIRNCDVRHQDRGARPDVTPEWDGRDSCEEAGGQRPISPRRAPGVPQVARRPARRGPRPRTPAGAGCAPRPTSRSPAAPWTTG